MITIESIIQRRARYSCVKSLMKTFDKTRLTLPLRGCTASGFRRDCWGHIRGYPKIIFGRKFRGVRPARNKFRNHRRYGSSYVEDNLGSVTQPSGMHRNLQPEIIPDSLRRIFYHCIKWLSSEDLGWGIKKYSWWESNPWPPDPQSGTLNHLSYSCMFNTTVFYTIFC